MVKITCKECEGKGHYTEKEIMKVYNPEILERYLVACGYQIKNFLIDVSGFQHEKTKAQIHCIDNLFNEWDYGII